MFKIGMKRCIEENDIYEITNSLRSEQNTDALAREWDLELKKKSPKFWHCLLKVQGYRLIAVGMLYTIGEILST